jgi:hypothetical protein
MANGEVLILEATAVAQHLLPMIKRLRRMRTMLTLIALYSHCDICTTAPPPVARINPIAAAITNHGKICVRGASTMPIAPSISQMARKRTKVAGKEGTHLNNLASVSSGWNVFMQPTMKNRIATRTCTIQRTMFINHRVARF